MSRPCATGVQQYLTGGTPVVEYVRKTIPALTPCMRDVPFVFSKPYRFICMVGINPGASGASMYLHFDPLNLDPTAANTNPNGSEHWIPLAVLTADTLRGLGKWLRFRIPITTFYIDSNDSLAGPTVIQFAGTNDLQHINILTA